MELVKSLKNMPREKQLRGLGLLWRKGDSGQDLTTLYSCLKGGCAEVVASPLCHVPGKRTRGNSHRLSRGGFRLGIRKKISVQEWSGIGVSCPGRQWSHCLWKCSRDACSTWGYSSGVIMVVLDWLLDWMIFKVSSNRNVPVILRRGIHSECAPPFYLYPTHEQRKSSRVSSAAEVSVNALWDEDGQVVAERNSQE